MDLFNWLVNIYFDGKKPYNKLFTGVTTSSKMTQVFVMAMDFKIHVPSLSE